MKYVEMKYAAWTLALMLLLTAGGPSLYAHCQIPCGIYDDEARFTLMLEDVTTIEKSMKQIAEIGGQEKPNWNQLARWVGNKEDHAAKLSETVTYYFMAQRIKPPADHNDEKAHAKYVKEVTLLHQMLVHSMKAKQTTDLEHVEHLRSLIGKFKHSYMGEHSH
ncbi:MAG: superoxide dismutase [bacterium]|nr:superoxide dismutase [bacterium]